MNTAAWKLTHLSFHGGSTRRWTGGALERVDAREEDLAVVVAVWVGDEGGEEADGPAADGIAGDLQGRPRPEPISVSPCTRSTTDRSSGTDSPRRLIIAASTRRRLTEPPTRRTSVVRPKFAG